MHRRTSRRLRSALAAGFVAISTCLQLGCGVLHCAPVVAGAPAAVPSCHEQPAQREDGTPAHDPGEGTGACCVVAPLEPGTSSVASSHAVTIEPVPLAGVSATPVAPSHVVAIDTGPPRTPFSGAALPLRV